LEGLFGKDFKGSERNWKVVHVKWNFKKQVVVMWSAVNLFSACSYGASCFNRTDESSGLIILGNYLQKGKLLERSSMSVL
jgi:hypothetical protein